jgi:hypothetical protein
MVAFRKCGPVALTVFFAAACGGANSSSDLFGPARDGSVDGTVGANKPDASATDDTSSTPDAGNVNDSGSSAPDVAGDANDSPSSVQDASADGTPSSQDASDASDAPIAPCPDLRGTYSVTVVDGQGCGTLNASAPQCIRQAQSGCGITFRSNVSGGSVPAITGDASLQNDGSFVGAALTEGTDNRTGCTGTWDSTMSALTVDCGGTGSSQSCVVTLQRTGSACN